MDVKDTHDQLVAELGWTPKEYADGMCQRDTNAELEVLKQYSD